MEQTITTSAAYKAAEAYEQFIVSSIFRYWTPLFLKRIPPQPGEKVLDVACGTGVVARSVVPLVKPRGAVVGVDINPSMLQVACTQFSDHCDEVDWREGRAEDLPFPDASFDLVLCQQGLQFFKDRPLAVREMHRVLRPKGRVGIEVWQSIEHNSFYERVFNAIASVFNVPATDLASSFSYGNPDDLKSLIIAAGFQQAKIEQVRLDVHFHEVNRFIEQTFKSLASVIPAFARLDNDAQIDLQTRVTQDLSGLFDEHNIDGVLTFPMSGNIATGIA